MRKNLIGLLACVTLLSSCGGSHNSEVDPSKSSTAVPTSIPSSSGTFDPGSITEYFSDTWDSQVLYMIDKNTQGGSKFVPVPKASHYYTFYENIDGIDCTIVGSYETNTSTIEKTYENQMVNKGFVLSSEYPCGYYMISKTDDLCVQYSLEDAGDAGIIFQTIIYRISNRLASWPTELIDMVIGEQIPVPNAESFSAYFDQYTLKACIYANNTGATGIVEYHNQVLGTGKFTVKSNTADGYVYESKDKYIVLEVYPSYDEYNRESLYIRVMNNWPHLYISQCIGEDLPHVFSTYVEGNVTFNIYKENTLLVYNDYATDADYENFCASLVSKGWVLTDTKEGEISVSKYYTKTIKGTEVTFVAAYGTTQIAGVPVQTIILIIDIPEEA